MRGPKPAPTELKILKGEKNRSRINANEPTPPPSADAPPPDMSEAALSYWTNYAPMLLRVRVLSEADRRVLQELCESLVDLEAMRKEVRADGYGVTNGGTVSPHFLLPSIFKAQAHVAKLLAELGMTPSSRSRVRALPPTAGKSGRYIWNGRVFGGGETGDITTRDRKA